MLNKLPNVDTYTLVAPFPAAGKGTLVEHLVKVLPNGKPVEHFEVGGLVRQNIKAGTELGKQAVDFSNRGLNVPDEIIVPAIRQAILNLNRDATWLIDGFPRNGAQVQDYVDLMNELGRADHALQIDVPAEVAAQRMILRAEKAIAAGKEPRRDDIDEQARKTRLAEAERDMTPVLNYFSKFGKITVIDGTRSIEEVRMQTNRALFEIAEVEGTH